MIISIIEVAPGSWRWVFCNSDGAVLASSRPYASPAECWHSIAQMRMCAPVFG
jgi:uncharacterized protein YegP (UPF0339 family)